MVALGVREAQVNARVGFPESLDAFGERLHTEVAGDVHQGLQQPALGLESPVDVAHEPCVEFEEVRRHLAQLQEARLAGAEIVVGETDAVIAQPRPKLETYRYAMPGEANIPQREMLAFNRDTKERVKIKAEAFKDQNVSVLMARVNAPSLPPG